MKVNIKLSHSIDTKDKQSNSCKTKQRIKCIHTEEVFDSITALSIKINRSTKRIRDSINKKQRCAGKFYVRVE